MIKVYKTGAALVEEHKGLLEANSLESGFFYLDALYLDQTDKQNYAIAVTEGERTLLSMKVVPYNMMMLGDSSLIGQLVDFLLEEGFELDSVMCNERLGEVFTAYMSRETGTEYYEALAMDYMECAVPYAPTDSAVSLATLADVREIHECMDLFAEECGLEERTAEETIRENIGRYHILRTDGRIAAVASLNDDTHTRKRISSVYTRPAFRGQGLAGKVVNAVLNDILASGFIADLNVDQRNPVTNRLYRKLGFRPVFSQGQYRPALIETVRLRLRPMTDAEMETLTTAGSDESMKAAYGEMLAAARANPRDRVFAAPWRMERREDGVVAGHIGFKGLTRDGMVELGYCCYDPYRDVGYTTEAVCALTRWALSQGCVKRVEAEIEADNAASRRVLEKSGFVPTGHVGRKGPRFVFKT